MLKEIYLTKALARREVFGKDLDFLKCNEKLTKTER